MQVFRTEKLISIKNEHSLITDSVKFTREVKMQIWLKRAKVKNPAFLAENEFRIGLYDWLDYTYKNYIDLIVKVNQKKIEKTTFDIAVLEAIPLISDYILNKNPKATDEEIMKVFGMPQEIVSSVMSKPISYLRKNKDTSDRIKELKTRLKELKKFDPVAYTEQIINQL